MFHVGVLHKRRLIGIAGKLSKWFSGYLDARKQSVVLQGVESKSNGTNDITQGSILGLHLFLIFINDIAADIGSSIRFFADATSLYIVVENPGVDSEILNADTGKNSSIDWRLAGQI